MTPALSISRTVRSLNPKNSAARSIRGDLGLLWWGLGVIYPSENPSFLLLRPPPTRM